MDCLPQDVLNLVIKHAPVWDVLSLGRVCKRLAQACGDDCWHRLCLKYYFLMNIKPSLAQRMSSPLSLLSNLSSPSYPFYLLEVAPVICKAFHSHADALVPPHLVFIILFIFVLHLPAPYLSSVMHQRTTNDMRIPLFLLFSLLSCHSYLYLLIIIYTIAYGGWKFVYFWKRKWYARYWRQSDSSLLSIVDARIQKIPATLTETIDPTSIIPSSPFRFNVGS